MRVAGKCSKTGRSAGISKSGGRVGGDLMRCRECSAILVLAEREMPSEIRDLFWKMLASKGGRGSPLARAFVFADH